MLTDIDGNHAVYNAQWSCSVYFISQDIQTGTLCYRREQGTHLHGK